MTEINHRRRRARVSYRASSILINHVILSN
jgi:hypothetical protein